MKVLARICLLLAFTLPAAAARADEAACKAVLDAIVKLATTPVRQKVSIEGAGGRVIQSELIHLGDRMYMQLQGRWLAKPYDGQKIASDARQAMDKSEHSCTRAGSEAVEGQPALVYTIRSKTAQGSSESKVWISPSSGLPLRQHTTQIEGAAAGGKHDVLYDYKDVKAPPGVN